MEPTTQTQKVGRKTLNKVLDLIQQSNGIGQSEMATTLKLSSTSIYYAVEELIAKGCISEGAIQVPGKTNLKVGYFYESDLPKEDIRKTK